MKPIEELNISPWPWKSMQNSGYDQETGEFNTSDTVYDADENVLTDWWNGETYGDVNPNAEADANLIAAAPEMYECLREAVNEMCRDCMETKEECPQKDKGACFVLRWRKVLAKAAGESL